MPSIAKAVDERLSLQIEEGALLWCMRMWVVGAQRGVRTGARIDQMMEQLGAPDAALYFDGFMFALSHGATRPICVDCVCQPSIAADERALLGALGLAQESRPFEALLLLRGMLTAEGARAALRSAEGLGAALARAGRFLPAPQDGVSQFAFPVALERPDGTTIH